MTTDVYVFLARPDSAYSGPPFEEIHPFGPSQDFYHTDLEIKVPVEMAPGVHALAVVSGLARLIRETPASKTCTLVLKPIMVSGLSAALGGGSVVFVYRNLDTSLVSSDYDKTRIPTFGDPPPVWNARVNQLIADFQAGTEALWFEGGDKLGTAYPKPTESFPSLGFEIVFIPNGMGEKSDSLAGSEFAWPRLIKLLGEDNPQTRRLDPATFYAAVQAAPTGIQLAPTHAGHELLTLLTRRILLELRDEYNKPFAGKAIVVDPLHLDGTPYIFTAFDHGTVVVETSTPDVATSYSVMVLTPGMTPPYMANPDWRYVLSELPSGDAAAKMQTKSLQAPSLWALQALFMYDEDHPDHWFPANNYVRDTEPLPRFTEGNIITPILDGVESFKQYTEAIRTATQSGHFIYLVDWEVKDDFHLIPHEDGTTLLELLSKAAHAGAAIRGLFWEGSRTIGVDNRPVQTHINALPHSRTLITGTPNLLAASHHQKFLIVNGNSGRFAFCGGIDIVPKRLDTQAHDQWGAFHDVHAKVEGKAVDDLQHTFVDRWNGHPAINNGPEKLPNPESIQKPGSMYVQVARTYPGISEYAFAPKGSYGPLNAALRAFSKAQHFIYIEDQYLTPYPGDDPSSAAGDTLGILQVLKKALERIDYLIIVIPNHTDQYQNRSRRKLFIEGLRAVNADKVHVFYLGREYDMRNKKRDAEFDTEGGGKGCSGSPVSEVLKSEIYVHSKVWIVDDVCAKIGSANMNRRSYTQDSEIDLVVVDGALTNGARRFARDFRKKLWGEHLNLDRDRQHLLEDYTLALEYWKNPPIGARIRPYKHAEGADPLIDRYIDWDVFVDPDGRPVGERHA